MLKPLHNLYDLPLHRCPPKHIEWSLVLEESRWRRLDFSGADRLGIPKSKVQCKTKPHTGVHTSNSTAQPLRCQFPHQHPRSNSTPHYQFTIGKSYLHRLPSMLSIQKIWIPKIGTRQMNSWVIRCHKGPTAVQKHNASAPWGGFNNFFNTLQRASCFQHT